MRRLLRSIPQLACGVALLGAGTLLSAEDLAETSVHPIQVSLPIWFEPNQGQADPSVKFLSRAPGYLVALTSTEAIIRADRADPIRVRLAGANAQSRLSAIEPLPGKLNYLIGNDPQRWRTSVPTYAAVTYQAAYPGVDVVLHGSDSALEYDFLIAPGADPSVIRLAFDGPSHLAIDSSGDLILQTQHGELRHRKPVVYQDIDGVRRYVDGHYRLFGAREVGFHLAQYDRSRPLIIDPVLLYSTYLGGSMNDDSFAMAVDSSGYAYVIGQTASMDFPTKNPVYPTLNDSWDVFIAKLDPASTGAASLVYATYLGGSDAGPFEDEYGHGIAVDGDGCAYVVCATSALDFPLVQPFQATYAGGSRDGFVAKLDATGSILEFSSYLGGSDSDTVADVTIGTDGSLYVVGTTTSPNFPTTPSFQPLYHGGNDAFVMKLAPSGLSIVYSSYLGGTGFDGGTGVRVDAAGNAFVAGDTYSSDFPVQSPFQATLHGPQDVFIAKLDPASTGAASLVYATYLGGSEAGPFEDEYGHGLQSMATAAPTWFVPPRR